MSKWHNIFRPSDDASFYRVMWVVSSGVAIVFAVPVALLEVHRPWVISIPISIGVLWILLLELFYEGRRNLGHASHASLKDEMQEFRKLAEDGVVAAQFLLGRAYERGEGLTINKQEAIKWYLKAAQNGNMKAQHNLGMLLIESRGDEIEALKWLFKAADNGSIFSQFTLGLIYSVGRGVDRNPIEALKWYRLAAENGDPDAQYNLALMLVHGDGGERNLEEAKGWYRKAAAQGKAYAANNLKALEKGLENSPNAVSSKKHSISKERFER
jgi:TPR repeat protein